MEVHLRSQLGRTRRRTPSYGPGTPDRPGPGIGLRS